VWHSRYWRLTGTGRIVVRQPWIPPFEQGPERAVAGAGAGLQQQVGAAPDEIRIENWLAPNMGEAKPVCTGGGGACPPEDCDGPAGFMAGRNAMLSLDALEDLDTVTEIIGEVVLERRMELLDDEDTHWRLERAVERSQARERVQGQALSRRAVNARLRRNEHRELMHQQC